MIFPVNAHHRNICRYPSKEDQTYVLVESSIVSMADSRGSHSKSEKYCKDTQWKHPLVSSDLFTFSTWDVIEADLCAEKRSQSNA